WLSGEDTSASNSAQAGLAASSLLDVNALPSWLREANQEQQPGSAPAFPPPTQPQQTTASQVPNNQTFYNQLPNGQVSARNSNLSAASFIDMDALPDWYGLLKISSKMERSYQSNRGWQGMWDRLRLVFMELLAVQIICAYPVALVAK